MVHKAKRVILSTIAAGLWISAAGITVAAWCHHDTPLVTEQQDPITRLVALLALAGLTLTLGLWLDRPRRRSHLSLPAETAYDVGFQAGLRVGAASSRNAPIGDPMEPFARQFKDEFGADTGPFGRLRK